MPSATCKCGKKSIVQYQNTGITKLSDAGAAADKWRLVEDFTARYNSLVEIPGIAIFLAERRNMVLRCFQDGFLAHVHKYLGFLVTDPVDMLR